MEGLGVLEEMGELTRRGEAFALATVVWRQGPSSSQSGSRAIITAEGELHGWIGGACAEPVVIREAQRVMAEGTAKLLLLGTPEQFGASVPDGMTVIPISCQSEGAIEVYIEPVLPVPHLVIVGDSPLARTLASLASALGWRADLVRGPDFATVSADERSMIVVATQGHDDEDVLERPPGPPTWGWSDHVGAGPPCSATSPTGACRRISSSGSGCRPDWTWAALRTRRSRSPSWPNWSSCEPPARWRGRG